MTTAAPITVGIITAMMMMAMLCTSLVCTAPTIALGIVVIGRAVKKQGSYKIQPCDEVNGKQGTPKYMITEKGHLIAYRNFGFQY